MKYKKCPYCEVNYIKEEEETRCIDCLVKSTPTQPQTGVCTNDFSCIVNGRIYGTNTRKIYEKFCETLGWDKSKANCFGWQTPLHAENCDANRENDVWFICYPNYRDGEIDSIVDDEHVAVWILNNGDDIKETVIPKIGSSKPTTRITFVRTSAGYKFLGVYILATNGTTRTYRRISKKYPF